ncbi:MAG: antitoxin [Chloroflexi bacterium]|nr:antitoxin [Chloroflexota bacterium]MCY3938148.1 antitoxin [Chloroflexota bacterium]
MRTTLTLDDDIADALREQARLLNKPFNQIVNDALRRGLSPSPPDDRPVFRVKPHHSGFKPGIDPLKLNQLNDQLEVEEFLRKNPR